MRIGRFDLHLGGTPTGWWVWFLRGKDGPNWAAAYGVGWGWDDDVPWSWLPTIHQSHTGQQDGDRVNIGSHAWLSWLGLSIGHTSKSKWTITLTGGEDAGQ